MSSFVLHLCDHCAFVVSLFMIPHTEVKGTPGTISSVDSHPMRFPMTRWLLPAALLAALAAPLPAADPPKFEIPYRLTDTKHVLVRAKLNGKGPYNFILDTGAPAVFIPKKVASAVGIKTDREGWGTFDKFEVEGGLSVDKARTRVADLFQLEGMNGMGLAGVELHGVIGYNVLAKYRVTYDFAADKLVFIHLPDFEPPAIKGIGRTNSQGGLEILGPMMKMLAGFMGIQPNFDINPRGFLGVELDDSMDGVFVKRVVADGPAAKGGLKAGDKIESIAMVPAGKKRGKPRAVDIDDMRDWNRVLAEVNPGDEAHIKVRRGDATETVTVTLGKGL